jgi:hypothetical protein
VLSVSGTVKFSYYKECLVGLAVHYMRSKLSTNGRVFIVLAASLYYFRCDCCMISLRFTGYTDNFVILSGIPYRLDLREVTSRLNEI